jgi:membrane protease subunit HflK
MPDNNNPWGNRGRKPSDLDDLIQDGIKKLVKSLKGRSKPPGGGEDKKSEGNGKSWIIILIAAVIYLLFQSIFQIQPGEQGVVLRFGRYHHISSPGLNFKYPLVEKIIKVDVETIRKEEFGSKRSIGNRGGLGTSSSLMDLESLMITSDKNVVQLNWVVQYKIRDPENFLFNIENPRAAVRDISETVIRRLVGNRDFDYVLNNRNELAVSSRTEMQELLNKYNSGIQIVVVQLQDVNPPDAVRPSFDEVNEAEQDKIRLGNEAQKEVNQILPRAEGEAKQTIEKAQGYAIERVNIAKGDVARFNSIYKEYRLAKKVTRTRMYIETLTESLPKLKEVIVVDQSNNGVLPLLHLGGTVGTTVTTPAK